MHPDDPGGVRGRVGERSDQQRRGIGCEDAVAGHDGAQALEQRALDLEALGRRLDHELARRQVFERRRRLEPCLRLLGLLGSQSAAADAAIEVLSDSLQTALERGRIGIVDERPRARETGELRDPGSHRPGARDADHARRSDLVSVGHRRRALRRERAR